MRVEIMAANLPTEKAQALACVFESIHQTAQEWAEKAQALTVKDENDTPAMEMARIGRLHLRQIRLDIEKKRKELGEAALREKQAIDRIAKSLLDLIAPIEQDLKNKELYREIKQQERMEALRLERAAECKGLDAYLPVNINLGALTPEVYKRVKEGAEADRAAEIAKEKAREEAEAAKAKALEEETRKAKAKAKELAEKMKALQAAQAAERQRHEEEAKKAREEAKAAAAAREKQEQELSRYKKEIEAAKKAHDEAEAARAKALEKEKKAEVPEAPQIRAATDREALLLYGQVIEKTEIPACTTAKGVEARTRIAILQQRFISFIRQEAGAL